LAPALRAASDSASSWGVMWATSVASLQTQGEARTRAGSVCSGDCLWQCARVRPASLSSVRRCRPSAPSHIPFPRQTHKVIVVAGCSSQPAAAGQLYSYAHLSPVTVSRCTPKRVSHMAMPPTAVE
jgi:hypothetical protein